MTWPPSFRGLWGRKKAVRRSPFYQTYPYHGQCDIVSADKRGAIDFGLAVFYNRIPKAGNTTVIMNLERIRKGANTSSRQVKKTFTRPSELSVREVVHFDRLFKFTIVRNPYTRVLSAYLDKVASGRKVIEPARRSPPPSFREFCSFLEQGGWPENAHWAPQTDLLLLPPEAFDFIGKLETLEESLAEAFRRAGLSDRLPSRLACFVNHGTDANSKLAVHYDDYCRSVIRRIYASDFAAFGYQP